MFKLNLIQDKRTQFFLYALCHARSLGFVNDRDANIIHKSNLESQSNGIICLKMKFLDILG